MMNIAFTRKSGISSQDEEISPLSLDKGIVAQLSSLRDLSFQGKIGIRKIGQIFTPPTIVKKILDLVGYKSDSDIENKSILDPSCGMGAFVVEAVSRLRKNLITECGYNPRNREDALQIIKRVCCHIHGIEISETAARNAAISYLFPLREEVLTISKVDRNYRPPVSIYIFDALDPRVRPRDNFDFVVGNPPYVQYWRLKPSLRESYKRYFTTARARYNTYGLFYERSLSWLKNKGVLGFISSNRFFHTDYGKSLRDLLISKTKIVAITDFKDSNLFEGVETYPTIIIAEKEKRLKGDWKFPYSYATTVKTATSLSPNDWKETFVIQKLGFPVRQDRLSAKPWIFLPEKLLDLFSKIMENHLSLLHFCDNIGVGVATGMNDVFVFSQKPENIEEELLFPVIRGRDIRKNRIDWKGTYLLSPYELRDGLVVPIKISEFPKTKKYLEASKKKLMSKYHAKHKKNWFETHDKINPKIMTKKKIVFPDIAKESRFAIDEGRFICLNTCYYITHESGPQLDFLNAILNSTLLEILMKARSPKLSQGRHRYMKRYIKDLPIVDPRTIEESTKNRIIDCMKEGNWNQLDDIVYKIYGVPMKEKTELERISLFL